ncbi:MAG: GTP-dependent dephospho-CoA kinase family protein [Candidatus Micrarchaeia archaeon]
MQSRNGILHLHIDKFRPKKDLLIPDELREVLSNAFGEILNINDIPRQLSGSNFVISVGDETTDNLLGLGIKPDLAIFDLKVERKLNIKLRILANYKQRKIVSNPPGRITIDLWNTISAALADRNVNAIQVDGEEDLATLVCVYLAKEGSVVLYGVPSKGVCIVRVNREIKRLAERILREAAK